MTLRLERPEGVLRPDLVVIEIEFRLVYVGVRSEPKWLGFYRIYLVMEDSERCPNGFPVLDQIEKLLPSGSMGVWKVWMGGRWSSQSLGDGL
ncbi:uncharacterized protein LOC9306617 isoform X3 [Arabidopsis lyrata subsp. lyrata]|uniref:uncharacterized protein LOC9306617 isoform X3 n=1 Tax=Arabidopsis lyrata subsp. lyrata TaxID=81972 RepID=UPI000A29ADDC|nr:uncharacterized protein LOC9306617 isoform X3 [Arabidopsis lyrata subsp. lyrata]|eukprot:XP_020875602.1 uncharacterized protein LOC9306617 isoform X3 [Arabidopsis lyrata subsp. lyrata]